MGLTVLALAAPFYFFTEGDLLIFLLVVAGAAAAYYYYGTTVHDKIEKRTEEMLSEFSDVVSKLALLVNSGMILREAWERTAYSKEGIIYDEMRRSVITMQNGDAETDALFAFGQRCVAPEIRKFSSTLIQGITKGNSDLAVLLTQQSKEVWELKKQHVHRQGELANNKLLLPMCLTFIGILIMVIVPVFSNIGVKTVFDIIFGERMQSYGRFGNAAVHQDAAGKAELPGGGTRRGGYRGHCCADRHCGGAGAVLPGADRENPR